MFRGMNLRQIILDCICIALCFLTIAVTVILYPRLPERIAQNFNAAGEVTRYGSKSVLFVLLGVMVLMLCGVSPTEAIGASVGCLTGYGPGLGASGGFGSYAAFSHPAMWVCTLLMLLGRLECMTVIILFLPRFWRK